jgi:dsRNA-specific ribonuclease
MNQSIPSYTWTRQASGKAPYTCTIEIGGTQYIGHAGRSKKEAEIKAAWTALLAIKGILLFLF